MNNDISIVKIETPHNQIVWKSKIDIDGTLDINPSTKELIKLIKKFAKSVTETSSKVQEAKTYDEIINDLIYKNKWREFVDKEL